MDDGGDRYFREIDAKRQREYVCKLEERIRELELTLLSTQMQSEERLRRVRELEDERDIFARTLDKRDAENKRLREAIKKHREEYVVGDDDDEVLWQALEGT